MSYPLRGPNSSDLGKKKKCSINCANVSSNSCTPRQVFSDVDHKVVRGHVEQVKAQALKLKELPSTAADTTTTFWLPSVGQIHHDAPGLNLALLSKTVQASAINKRSLQESDCADGTTPISVTSTVFPIMEGCLLPVVVEGAVWYTTGVATIFPASASSTDVSSQR